MRVNVYSPTVDTEAMFRGAYVFHTSTCRAVDLGDGDSRKPGRFHRAPRLPPQPQNVTGTEFRCPAADSDGRQSGPAADIAEKMSSSNFTHFYSATLC